MINNTSKTGLKIMTIYTCSITYITPGSSIHSTSGTASKIVAENNSLNTRKFNP
jgi:hypothetical protein